MLTQNHYWLIVAAVNCIPHAWYFWLWLRPTVWTSACSRWGLDPSHLMASIAGFIKLLQFTALALWIAFAYPNALDDSVSALVQHMRSPVGAFALLVLAFGQTLNFAVYNAIGIEGVYYGSRFGKTIPWVTGWPFGGPFSVPHPQYCGCVLSIWAVLCLISSETHYVYGGMPVLWRPFGFSVYCLSPS
uniref:phosphatidyl-N-methylethanolamine N-methyltransferase n=1 Tax=Chromera velia CCMP2878 TaxID=1169474 RepID=A0A0G4G8T2_9ALVE|eukprot:Cvel_20786.t1-p1 / transcript=Cvel_20786.t1 / gene=Cvel_20786 / organism=Chromera_velia_CCMP2878 / gene_product=hypothetical protein / transcript_product=hypothetical protein / location=Cvel_scaffold1897:31100-37059(-) / protein_length=187 / sequence_SO=supercontig / SO=protein_coding / is_pseudo=false